MKLYRIGPLSGHDKKLVELAHFKIAPIEYVSF
jgi:hypothetical protein